jgi:hypothetical protein
VPAEAKPLFRPDVLRTHLAAFELPAHVESCRPKLVHWAELIASGRADRFKEQEILGDFLGDVFVELLGYVRPADAPARYTISREKHVQVNGKFADAVLGDFGNGNDKVLVALEGKGPKDPLDRPYGGRRVSAVDQGYGYAINLPCDWIVVTSIRQTRLYAKSADQHTYERFDTEDLASNDTALKRFVFLLGAPRVVPSAGRCHLYELLSESERVGRDLTGKFYLRYAEMRRQAFARLCEDNPGVARQDVLTCAQKLLDRILFCAFCEDRGLLPVNTIEKAHAHRNPYLPGPIWDNFRGLFSSINRGNAALGIHAYNGGLFADDPVLDNLRVSDDVCAHFRELGAYDYRPAHQAAASAPEGGNSGLIDVDILGHIFEQSISDLERMRNELDRLAEPASAEKHKTRRKKEGAFYTPAFITRYIVRQALGGVLSDRFERLRQSHAERAKGAARAALADPQVYQLDQLKQAERAVLVAFWEAWQDDLATIRLLDPACGSGAFLIEAFDQLHAAYEAANDRLAELRGHRTLFDLDKRILENNLYGVDLNDEAVQICRLSLWIKTAQRGKILTSLDHTIRVGNSVVTDPKVDPRAFDWQKAFPEVFAGGGFDVVVSNPPYIRQEWLAPYKPHWEKVFQSYHGVADIFTYFFERGIQLLRDHARLAFITSGSWVRANFAASLRAHIGKTCGIESIVDFGEFQPFEDAEMIRPTIIVLRKAAIGQQVRIFKWLSAGPPPENLEEIIAAAPTKRIEHLGEEPWDLESDEILALRDSLASAGQRLGEYAKGKILRGVITGLTEAFVLDAKKREQLIAQDARSAEIIKPFAQGTHLRPWYVEATGEYLLELRSSANFKWPWSNAGNAAEQVFREEYPAVYEHLAQYRDAAVKRQDQGQFWWELRSCAYWENFDESKIVWPDISKLPRFSMDLDGRVLGNTGYFIPGKDYFLLGVLSSWALWFYISKTAQPLRLRAGRWQYRLFAQFMEQLPIPLPGKRDRQKIAELAERCCEIGLERYGLEINVRSRLVQAFGIAKGGVPSGALNTIASGWWKPPLNDLGAALQASFKLKSNPFRNPRTADEWEPYLREKRAMHETLSMTLASAEGELNERVCSAFRLSAGQIAILMQAVEH